MACATPAAIVDVTDDTSSLSMINVVGNVGVTHNTVVEQDFDYAEEGRGDVTEASILAELGMHEPYGVRHSGWEAETQRVASGTLSFEPVHPADVPVGSDVQLGYGVLGRDSVVVQTSCHFALDDVSVRAGAKGRVAADGLVTGSSPAFMDDNMSSAAMLKEPAAATAYNIAAAENPCARGTAT